jgi:hypothetical protein
MKAVRYHGPRQPFRLEEADRRDPEAGEVLVRVAVSGMCHTELHFKSGLLDLELARIGSLLSIFADSPSDKIGSSSPIDTFATRLSAQPLSFPAC